MTLSGATTLGQSGPGSNGNEGVLHIPQSSSNTGTSTLFSVISRTLVGGRGSYPPAEVQSVCSTVPTNLAILGMSFCFESGLQKE